MYDYLDKLSVLPRMIVEARKLLGTVERAGAANSPTIMAWAKEVGGKVGAVYTADSIAWCGLFMAVVAKRAGKTIPTDPLWALNWSRFGVAAGQPGLGDVLTFVRDGGGHVALYVGEDGGAYHGRGGRRVGASSRDARPALAGHPVEPQPIPTARREYGATRHA